MQKFMAKNFFGDLDGHNFSSYRELEENILTVFNKYRGNFPPRYSYRDLIEWALDNQWIIEESNGRFHVQLKSP
ncbi:MAG TPA: hypothetical protein VK208_04570 [Pyrinomonadaceae bacterium]|nr:hypothetical protein [Pyrinomonadaceae bacterium]